jgi:hypothetical protein
MVARQPGAGSCVDVRRSTAASTTTTASAMMRRPTVDYDRIHDMGNVAEPGTHASFRGLPHFFLWG